MNIEPSKLYKTWNAYYKHIKHPAILAGQEYMLTHESLWNNLSFSFKMFLYIELTWHKVMN